METQEFNKYLFNRIKKDLEKIFTTKYKKHNFNSLNSKNSYKSINPFNLSVSDCIGNKEAFDLAEKYSGINKETIENLEHLENAELVDYFKNNLEEYKKYLTYNDILEHFDFPESECYANVSNHVYNFVEKNKIHYWARNLVKEHEEICKIHKKEHWFYADYFYHNYDKLPIEIQKKGKTLYHEFELIKELKKNKKVVKLKEKLEKALKNNKQTKKAIKI